MIIIGAGLSGLLAATQFQRAQVFEAGPATAVGHRALLRFRSSAVGDAVGIEFRKVLVRKGVWLEGRYVTPDIRAANQYSLKVIGRLGDRSIWNQEPVERYIAPDDLIEQLRERVGSRVDYNTPFEFSPKDDARRNGGHLRPDPIISTMPMDRLVRGLDLKQTPAFEHSPIHVFRILIKNSDVFQTIYFPGPETSVYRASITGNMLIVESKTLVNKSDIKEVIAAFGLNDDGDNLDNVAEVNHQRYGKIAPIDDAWRRKFIVEATQRLNVYSLGRFAIWRNILVDDVLHDIAVIKKLLRGDAYASSLKGA